jgi:hypothetical protein
MNPDVIVWDESGAISDKIHLRQFRGELQPRVCFLHPRLQRLIAHAQKTEEILCFQTDKYSTSFSHFPTPSE